VLGRDQVGPLIHSILSLNSHSVRREILEEEEEVATSEDNSATVPSIPQTEEELAAFLGFSLDDLKLDTVVVGTIRS